ncbi:MAG: DUF2442 domain-containing protein [Caldilineaceae bacterium]
MPTATELVPARVTNVVVSDDTLSVDLEDGRTISVPIGWYPRLAHGTPAERAHYEISGAGDGIHWPELDEDIGVEGLLLGRKSMESPSSLLFVEQNPGGVFAVLQDVTRFQQVVGDYAMIWPDPETGVYDENVIDLAPECVRFFCERYGRRLKAPGEAAQLEQATA